MASFASSSESLKARLHLSHIPTPLLAGCAVLVLGAAAGVGAWLFGLAQPPAFSVDAGSGAAGVQVEGAAGLQGGKEQGAQGEADNSAGQSEGGAQTAGESGASGAEARGAASGLMVHVTGAVAHPGVYRVAADARVQDAVDAAGGLTGDAAGDAVNLARPVADGEQVRVPTQEEVQAQGAGGFQQEMGNAATASASGALPAASGVLVNINTATEAELDALPGVGPATAAAIVLEREEGGPFAKPEDIMRVPGIGEKKFAKLKDAICV